MMKNTLLGLMMIGSFGLEARASGTRRAALTEVPNNVVSLMSVATRVIATPNGGMLIIHPAIPPVSSDSFATIVDANMNPTSEMSVAKWISDRIRPDLATQLYTGAFSPDGDWLALSGGWAEAGSSKNGIFVLARSGESWEFHHLIPVAGTVREIAWYDDHLLLAAGYSALSRVGSHLARLVLYDRDGSKVADLLANEEMESLPDAIGSMPDTRLERVGAGRFALLDMKGHSIKFFSLEKTKSAGTSSGGFTASHLANVDVEAPQGGREALVAFGACGNGTACVARVRKGSNGRPAVDLLQYGDGGLMSAALLEEYWRQGFVADGALRALIIDPTDDDVKVIETYLVQ